VSSDWVVLFIGGPSSVGKTSAAKRIATISGATLLQADDVWLALKRAIDPKDSPVLHALSTPDFWHRPATELVALKRELAGLISSSLEFVVATHLRQEDRVVIEGVWITPEFAARSAYDGVTALERRRAAFVIEDSAPHIYEKMLTKRGAFGHWVDEDRKVFAAMEASYARWLRTQALMRKQPIVEARPVGHLAERILAVL
jgi:2-phosphoglycerate kinase